MALNDYPDAQADGIMADNKLTINNWIVVKPKKKKVPRRAITPSDEIVTSLEIETLLTDALDEHAQKMISPRTACQSVTSDSIAQSHSASPNVKFTLQRGISNTYDGLTLATDQLTHRLLQVCMTDSDRLDAVIIAAIMHPSANEMFTGVEIPRYANEMPIAVQNFAHGSGDLHTALNAVRTWLVEERDEENACLPKWCIKHGINLKGMRHVLQFVDPFRRMWDYEDPQVSGKAEATGHLMDELCDVLQLDLCYYLGHPSLGYKKIRNGHIVPICPSSVIHCLHHMPRYVCVYKPRHLHITGNNTTYCSYFVNITDKMADNIIQNCFPKHIQQNICNNEVTLVDDIENIGLQCLEELCRRWLSGSDKGLRMEISELIGNSHVIFDVAASIEQKCVQIYANIAFHCSVRAVMNLQINQIQTMMKQTKAELSFPVGSPFRLLIAGGVKCEQVLFPFLPPPDEANIQPLDALRKRGVDFVLFTTDVRISVELTKVHLSGTKSRSIAFRSTVFIKSLFKELNGEQWCIEHLHILDNHPVIVDIRCSDHATAGRATRILKDVKSVTILNERSAYRDTCGFQVTIDRRVMHVYHATLITKLNNYRRNKNVQLEYKQIWLENGDANIQLVTKSPSSAIHMIDLLRAFLSPKVKHVPKQIMRKYFNSRQLQYYLEVYSQRTSSFIHYRHREGHIYIYGKKTVAKEFLTHFNAFLKTYYPPAKKVKYGTSDWVAFTGIKLETGEVPNDLFIKFRHRHRNLEKFVKRESHLVNANVDLVRNAIWLQPSDNCDDVTPLFDRMKTRVRSCLVLDFGIMGRKFDLVKYEARERTCVTCYGDLAEYYTMEGCGHVMCLECLTLALQNATKESQLPITCPECSQPATIADIENWTRNMHLCTLSDLLKVSVKKFISENPKDYRVCTKLNCNGIAKYHEISNVIACGACSRKICPSCLKDYHKGMTCAEYEESLTGVDMWMKENSKTRKMCTHCSMGIEKIDGCNNVHCGNCHKSLCWVCMTVFDKSADCYKHMDATDHWNDQD